MIGNFVFKENGFFINTINKKILPECCTIDELKENNFLENQKKQAILDNFFKNYDYVYLNINPTWECNLRCKHCSVFNNLKIKDNDDLVNFNLIKFVDRVLNFNKNIKKINVSYVGGEPLLRAKKCFEITNDIKKSFSSKKLELFFGTTTNLSLKITDTELDFLNALDEIYISIDGDEFYHNKQRIPLIKETNPYDKTIENLQLLLEFGLKDKINIKCSLEDKELKNISKHKKFLRKMGYMGVDLDKIEYKAIHPTDRLNEKFSEFNSAKDYLKNGLIYSKPCCKYRFKSIFAIDPNGDVYDSYYTYARDKIFNLNEDYNLESIMEKRKETAENKFNCFKDDKCMKCPVLGFCWGYCVNVSTMVKNNPSNFCDQEKLVRRIENLNKQNKLMEIL